MWPDLRDGPSVSVRERPFVTEVNGTLMARRTLVRPAQISVPCSSPPSSIAAIGFQGSRSAPSPRVTVYRACRRATTAASPDQMPSPAWKLAGRTLEDRVARGKAARRQDQILERHDQGRVADDPQPSSIWPVRLANTRHAVAGPCLGDVLGSLLRQFHDWKGAAEVDTLCVPGATLYARMCGATLARAHARWGDRVAIARYLGPATSSTGDRRLRRHLR
jgi:Uncharacterized protein conserved in bacteria (DUF2252)